MMMVSMVTLMKNAMMEKVRSAGALTDAELYKSMIKDGTVVSEDKFNKMLLDLEIMGLVKVAWITKDEKRIEASEEDPEQDEYSNGRGGPGGNGAASTGGGQGRNGGGVEDTSYEASFPGVEK